MLSQYWVLTNILADKADKKTWYAQLVAHKNTIKNNHNTD